ncbi:autotransporter outer membrane beta-barrel domain-containing protein [Snodgrassella communis]|uniref:autotransporter outer membrane beta-barrel domain-containing protein n=1 Tax=Snodgrassella communis TaxID=2946699 RepID=UPI001EF666C0|nr:autotransporter outer membrane beta-barrel domain-containing protein [Snodgrassella communis]
MNTIYKSKWNESTRTWVACSELTRGKTKSNCLKIVASIALALATTSAFAANSVCPPPSLEGEINISEQECDIPSSENNAMPINKFTATEDSKINAEAKHFEVSHKNTDGGTSTAVGLTSSELTVDSMTINNSIGGLDSKALHLDEKSTLNIKSNNTGLVIDNHDTTGGDIVALVDIEDGSTLKLNDTDLQINNGENARVTNILRNQNSTINTGNGAIRIMDDYGGATSTIISNISNRKESNIIANEIQIKHQKDFAAQAVGIYQNGKPKDNPKITVNDIHITGQFQHAIKVERGDITSNRSTYIHQQVSKTNPSPIPSYAIYIANGSYTNNGDTTIELETLDEMDENPKNTKIPGIGLGDNGTVTNNGKITVNSGQNIAIRNFGKTTSTINNNGKIITQKDVDTIVNGPDANSQGSLTVNNTGELESQNPDNATTAGSVLKNFGKGELTINNEKAGIIKGNITNEEEGKITINNKDSGTFIDGNIINKKGGNIQITNETTLRSNIINEQLGSVTLTNKAMGSGKIENKDIGSISINNQGQMTGDITNSGNKADKDNIVINNSGTLMSHIVNNGGGKINITNNGEIKVNSIENTGSGDIILQNNKNIDGNLYNRGTGNFKFQNTGNYSRQIDNINAGIITLQNDGTIKNSPINNEGIGAIIINNLGNIDADSVITNNGDDKNALINITNEKSLLAPISNNKTGRIEFTNKETGIFKNSSLTNKGSGKIEATNAGSFNDISISSNGANGNIDFTNEKTGTFSGSLTSINSGTITAINKGTFTGTTTNINPNTYNNSAGAISLKNSGTWTNTGNSTLSELTNTGTIKFLSIPEANATDKNKYHTITVDGDYTGGGDIFVNTIWNKNENDPNFTDQLIIKGNVIGDAITTVKAENGIYGDITIPEIPLIHSAPVIHVDGNTNKNSFQGSAATKNAGKAELKRIDSKEGTDYAWTLLAEPKPDPVKPAPTEPAPTDPTEPVKPINPVPPKRVPIYAEPVSGYVQMPTADMELGFTTIGTLHERRSENQTNNINGANNTALGDTQQQTWGRVVVKHLDKDGKKRLDTAGSQSVLQIGHDFIIDENNKTGARRHIGGYVSYGHNENDFRDQYRAENGYIVDDHYTGKGRTDAVSIGGYGTFYGNNGGYVDLVGQVTYLRNKYNARSNESVHQNGWGAALSAEAGKSFIVYGNNWFVEPQAQLVYQYLSLDDFNDRYRHIDQHNPSALRGRMGMRFGYNGDTTDNLPPTSFYGIANIWHDFVNPKSVDIGRDTLKEEYAKTWGEIGAGIQLPITRQSDFYGDVRYEKNFGSDKRKGFKGTLGYKYTWL